jgi:hypothetical protein
MDCGRSAKNCAPSLSGAILAGAKCTVKLENVRQILQNMAVGLDTTRAQHQSLLKELQEERAAALTRISRRLERLIAQLEATREQIARSRGEDRARTVAAYRDLREQAVSTAGTSKCSAKRSACGTISVSTSSTGFHPLSPDGGANVVAHRTSRTGIVGPRDGGT